MTGRKKDKASKFYSVPIPTSAASMHAAGFCFLDSNGICRTVGHPGAEKTDRILDFSDGSAVYVEDDGA